MVIWIIGVSGSGKTTLATEVVGIVRNTLRNVVLLDGDAVRAALSSELAHTIEDRKANALRISHLSGFLEAQGIHVVASVASAFEETREWNRRHFREYYEVFIETPLESLIARDPKGLYEKALAGLTFLPGINQPFEKPEKPSEIIQNNGELAAFLSNAGRLASLITERDTLGI